MNTRDRCCSLMLAASLCARLGAAEDAAETGVLRRRAAVDGGLRWLAAHQAREGVDAGSWETDEPRYRSAVSSLVGLAFLAHGTLPGEGVDGQTLDAAMGYVLASMAPDGYLGQGDPSGMYIHAISTLFGLSYLGMSADPVREAALAEWCRRSLRVILEAQQVRRIELAQGGWRYTPHTDESDVSVTCWQLLVLHAARQCGYAIEPEAFEAALRYVNSAYVETRLSPDDPELTAGFLYRPGVSQVPEPTATGVAVSIKSMLERQQDLRVVKSLEFLRKYPPAWGGEHYAGYFYFAAFYLTQGMFQLGGEAWTEYMPRMQHVLLDHQAGDGHWPFPPGNTIQGQRAGPAYSTAMAVLILSLENQYLPMYQRQKRLF